jgi:general stress protein YciG
MWYMLSSIEKRRLHKAGLHPSSIDSRCNDARLHKFGSRAQTARNQNRTEQRELGREGGADGGGFHRVARSSMG